MSAGRFQPVSGVGAWAPGGALGGSPLVSARLPRPPLWRRCPRQSSWRGVLCLVPGDTTCGIRADSELESGPGDGEVSMAEGGGGFLMGEPPAQGHLASPCFGLPCSRVGRTYRGIFQGRRTPDSWSQPPPRKRFPGGRGTWRVGPALHPQESGSGGLGHSLAACLVNNDIVINI